MINMKTGLINNVYSLYSLVSDYAYLKEFVSSFKIIRIFQNNYS